MLKYGISVIFLLLAVPTVLILFSPIKPVAWQAPDIRQSKFSCETKDANNIIEVETLVHDLPSTADGIAMSKNGRLFTALKSGQIVEVDPSSGKWKVVAEEKTARFSGIAVSDDGSAIFAADQASNTIYRFDIRSQESVAKGEILISETEGKKLVWTNDVLFRDNSLYFTITSDKRSNDRFRDELLEHRKNASVARYDLASGRVTTLAKDLITANGVSVNPDMSSLLVSETSGYKVTKIALTGSKVSTVIENLPAMPGNLMQSDRSDIYWVSLVAPRNPVLDRLAPYPAVRKLLAWIPVGQLVQREAVACAIELYSTDTDTKGRAVIFKGKEPLPAIATVLERNGVVYLSPYRSLNTPNKTDGRLFRGRIPK